MAGTVLQVARGADGRDPLARGAGRGRPRDRGARLRQRRRARLRTRLGHPAGRRPHQEPLRRAHVHPARPGAAQARPAAEVQPAARDRRRQAPRRRRRLDRARQHHAPDRADAARRRRARRSTCASPRRRSGTPATTASTCRRARRWSPTAATVEEVAEELGADSLAYLSLDGVYEAIARRARDALRRLLHRRLPAGRHRERATASSRSRPSCRWSASRSARGVCDRPGPALSSACPMDHPRALRAHLRLRRLPARARPRRWRPRSPVATCSS